MNKNKLYLVYYEIQNNNRNYRLVKAKNSYQAQIKLSNYLKDIFKIKGYYINYVEATEVIE